MINIFGVLKKNHANFSQHAPVPSMLHSTLEPVWNVNQESKTAKLAVFQLDSKNPNVHHTKQHANLMNMNKQLTTVPKSVSKTL